LASPFIIKWMNISSMNDKIIKIQIQIKIIYYLLSVYLTSPHLTSPHFIVNSVFVWLDSKTTELFPLFLQMGSSSSWVIVWTQRWLPSHLIFNLLLIFHNQRKYTLSQFVIYKTKQPI
jgi:hypothetical protein